MDNWNYPPGSDTADAPWNAPDAYEGVHTCDECEREEFGYGIDGEPCMETLLDDDSEEYVCPGILREPEPTTEADWLGI